MDFNDSPEEAAYRAKAREWLDANATLRDPDASKAKGISAFLVPGGAPGMTSPSSSCPRRADSTVSSWAR